MEEFKNDNVGTEIVATEKKKKEKKERTKWKELPLEVRKKKRKKYILIGVAVLFVGKCVNCT